MSLLLLLACAGAPVPGAPPLPDDSGGALADSGADSAGAPAEACNGRDDDGDGAVDEGFPDADANGRVDCLDLSCPDHVPTRGDAVEVDGSCRVPPPIVADRWDAGVEWTWTAGGAGVVGMPAVGAVHGADPDTQTGGKGEPPDIAFTTLGTNTLVLLAGDGGGTRFEVGGFDGAGGVAVADVDGDGAAEILAFTTDHRIAAVDGDGATRWVSAPFTLAASPQLAVADLDADGVSEVIGDVAVVDGVSGATRFLLGPVGATIRAPVVADLDQDGAQEILLGDQVFGADGVALWSADIEGTAVWAAVADTDHDPGGEVFFVGGDADGPPTVALHDADGSTLWRTTVDGALPGPPAAADLDGDGEVELVLPATDTLSAVGTDGALRWSVAVDDPTGRAGCSAFDFDADGAWEVVYADRAGLGIHDGVDGAVHFTGPATPPGTGSGYPVTADVDGDGAAEVVVASAGEAGAGITVIGHTGGGWVATGPDWGSFDFSDTNLEPDGTVPVHPPPSWQRDNLFRARAPTPAQPAADLVAVFTEVCVMDCTWGPVQVWFAVSNRGGADVPAGVSAAIYAVDTPVDRRVATVVLPAVPAGTRIDEIAVSLRPEDVGSQGLRLVVDPEEIGAGAAAECDETDNTDVRTEPACPG